MIFFWMSWDVAEVRGERTRGDIGDDNDRNEQPMMVGLTEQFIGKEAFQLDSNIRRRVELSHFDCCGRGQFRSFFFVRGTSRPMQRWENKVG